MYRQLIRDVNPWTPCPASRKCSSTSASFFPALTSIAFEWCAALLNTVSSTVLQQLHIQVHDPYCFTPDGAVFEALCAAIGSLPSGESLHDLDIHSPRANVPLLLWLWASSRCMLPALSRRRRRAVHQIVKLPRIRTHGFCTRAVDDARTLMQLL
ncbi:hypothetical protein VTO73DRAFT_11291 [Trametes versicolor]